ncbi:MAG: NAD-dependent epimerase/dehydratase family protein [bacterium]
MNISGSKILVIGGAGLIGSHVVDELVKEEEVGEIVIYDNFCRGTRENIEDALKDSRVKVFEIGGDITQTDILDAAMEGVDYVFHLAALWLLQCYEYPRSAFKTNIEGTFNVLEACVRRKVKKLIFSSSASVYGNAVEIPMTEDHPYNNRTFYGATKIAGEHMCRAFYERYGLNYIGLRYMNIYGPRQDYKGAYVAVIMKILDRIDQGLPPIIYGDGSQSYDFIYVQDAACANLCALKSDVTDRFYNVGCGVKTTIKEICELLLELTGSNLEIQYEPQGQTFVTHRIGSTEKAEKELGFKATTPLKEGLKRLIEWRQRHKKSGY